MALREAGPDSPAPDPMRVYLISSLALYREGLMEILARRDGIEVAGASEDPSVVPAGDAIVLLDMVGFDAAEVAPLVGCATDAPVVAINVPCREPDVIACAEAGLACCLTAEASLDDLEAAIRSVAHGEALCSPWTAAVLLRRVAVLARERGVVARSGALAAPRAHLTSRELQVIELIDLGLSNKEIASELSIELPTVKNHIHRILEKLGVRRRAEAAALVRSGAVGRARAGRSTSPTPA